MGLCFIGKYRKKECMRSEQDTGDIHDKIQDPKSWSLSPEYESDDRKPSE